MATARAVARYRQTRVVELVMAGWTYEAIAREVGYRSKGSVSKAFWRAVTAHEEANVRTYRALEASRLDALQLAQWEEAMAGSVTAAMAVLHIIDRRIRLFALDRPAVERASATPLVDPAFWDEVKETYGGNWHAYLEAAQTPKQRVPEDRAV